MKPPTRAPFYAAMYHGLCETARKHGYALAIHGTVTSDLDLIACPWTDEAIPAEELRNVLMEHINACDYEQSLVRFGLKPEEAKQIASRSAAEKVVRPHGRIAWNLYLDNGCKVDLSVMPRKEQHPIEAPVRRLLDLLGQLDPNCGPTRHPEWPLQLCGDEDAISELCQILNELHDLTKK